MRKKRIVFFCNYFQPMNYGENEISSALLHLGYEVIIVTGDRYFPFPNYEDTVATVLGPRQQRPGKSKVGDLLIIRNKVYAEFASRAFFFGVKNVLRSYKPDIIIVFGITTPIAIQVALQKSQSVQLILVDSNLPSEVERGNQRVKSFFYFLFRLFFAGLLTQKADTVIAVQEATAVLISTMYGITKNVRVVSHGTDTSLFCPDRRSRSVARKRLGIRANAFVIATCGKMIAAKGTHILFDAVAPLFMKYTDLHLLIIGDGSKEYKEQCMKKVDSRFHSCIHVTGFVRQQEIPALYNCADIAVWPLQESIAMNDAISCGVPIIVNDKIGVRERISNGNALLYMQNDVNDLRKKMEKMIADPHLRKEMGRRARSLALRKMSWQEKAKLYVAY